MNHGKGLQIALDNTAEMCRGELEYMRGQGFELSPELAALVDSPQGNLFASPTAHPAGEGAR